MFKAKSKAKAGHLRLDEREDDTLYQLALHALIDVREQLMHHDDEDEFTCGRLLLGPKEMSDFHDEVITLIHKCWPTWWAADQQWALRA